jgi:hypothetical protein
MSRETVDSFAPETIGKQTLEWGCCSGRVIGLRKTSSTHLSSVTSVTQDNTFVSVGSFVIVTTEFFLRGADGSETPFSIAGEDLPLRDGHLVTMIHGKGNEACYVALVNHTTRNWCLWGTMEEFLKVTCGLVQFDWQWISYLLLGGVLIFPALPVVLVLAAILAVVGALLNNAYAAAARQVEARLDGLAGYLLAQDAARGAGAEAGAERPRRRSDRQRATRGARLSEREG